MSMAVPRVRENWCGGAGRVKTSVHGFHDLTKAIVRMSGNAQKGLVRGNGHDCEHCTVLDRQ